ncbi:outer membrane beta-barrel protein [Niabella insulamsoli]|uniref:outer membrane beta-barrel protein n=1 Tax=Niabella insulamsoli TaxID=3144874 RepID=UPI0031FCEA38
MRVYLSLAFIICCSLTAFSQTIPIKGSLVDSSESKSLQNTVVALLNSKDSVLVDFKRAGAKGEFQFDVPDSNNYILLVTHPYFADFSEKLMIEKGKPVDMGFINLISKAKLLDEVIVKANRAMFMRGDTTVFTADSFKVAEGANVEELLKKLPGFQVDRNGNITAMGQQVKKVLVDGEEFFGSDPGIATKNLRADVVDQVKVYDRGSDQANFTGIDDGVRDRTIDLKLKEDKKKGYFGKIDAGGGVRERSAFNDDASKSRYYGAAMINAFKAKRKLSAYAISSNNGFMNLDWEDAGKYGGGGNSGVSDDGGIYIMYGGGDYNRSSGIPINYNAGVHYSNKFNQDKHSINGGYRYVRIEAPGNTQVFAKNFTPDSSWSTNSVNDFMNISNKHSGNFIYETKLDSMNTLKLTTGANFNFSKSDSRYNVENINDETGDFINTNERNSSNDVEQSAYNANLLWMHKFKKQYRTLSINTSFNANESKTDGFLYSKLDLYRDGVVDSTNIIDQLNNIDNSSSNVGARISYTEPLAKDFYLEASYGFNLANRNQLRDIFAKNGNSYTDRVDSLSNDYEFNEISNTPGLGFRYSNKKVNVNIGTSVGLTNYEQVNRTTNMQTSYDFTNHFPRARFNYKFTPNKGLWFYYNGRTIAPSLDQLQPIRVNTDPLNQVIGNPNLRPSFSHQFNLSYNSWKMLSETGLSFGVSGGFTQNAFVNFSTITNAVRTSQTVNTNGIWYGNLYTWYSKKFRSINLDFGLSPNINLNQRVDFVAGSGSTVKNITNNAFYNMRVRLSRDVEKKYRISLDPYFGYNIAKASVNTMANAKYWTGGGDVAIRVYLPKEFEINTNVDASLRQKDSRFPTNNNFVFWNAELIKWIYKKEFQLKITANDLLNQRNGYSRDFNSYSFTETYNTVLRRHFLLGFVWNFNKMNAGAPAPAPAP